ncbi:hypothetical protein CAAN1_13S02784 [[Candida] anglica]|uniref:Uncharacterized protein n=1 Tax=[Candida] anglica TaxID=148631 RepID=A0ABP0EG81_9ASCO
MGSLDAPSASARGQPSRSAPLATLNSSEEEQEPPRQVAHGVPAERLASPAGKGVGSHPTGSVGRSAGPCSGRATAWCSAPLRGDFCSTIPRQRNMASTASGPRSASGAARKPRREGTGNTLRGSQAAPSAPARGEPSPWGSAPLRGDFCSTIPR